jgi:hypothetical protein
VQHGYLRSPDGTFTTIDGPGAVLSIAIGITLDGTISGYFVGADDIVHSFLRAPDGTMTFFDDPKATPWGFKSSLYRSADVLWRPPGFPIEDESS